MNVTTLIGCLGNDPEIEYKTFTKDGEEVAFAVTKFNIAIPEYNKKTKKEEPNWIACECFGKTAENIAEYFKKGHKIGVVGKLKTDQWEKDGVKRSKTYVVVDSFDFLTKKDD